MRLQYAGQDMYKRKDRTEHRSATEGAGAEDDIEMGDFLRGGRLGRNGCR